MGQVFGLVETNWNTPHMTQKKSIFKVKKIEIRIRSPAFRRFYHEKHKIFIFLQAFFSSLNELNKEQQY